MDVVIGEFGHRDLPVLVAASTVQATVIPAKAGIQSRICLSVALGPRLRGVTKVEIF